MCTNWPNPPILHSMGQRLKILNIILEYWVMELGFSLLNWVIGYSQLRGRGQNNPCVNGLDLEISM